MMNAMQNESLIIAGGIFNLLFIAFHLSFSKLFNWTEELSLLTAINRSVMRILNLCLIFTFGIFAYISLFHYGELVTHPLGKTLLILMSLFWLFRAGLQVVFFGLKYWGSIVFFVIFLFGATIYLIPVI